MNTNVHQGTLPAPLVPPEVDLTDFPFMPLHVQRLRDSELSAEPDPEVFRANIISWCAAWHQKPGGTLPTDDKALARLLGYGRDLRTWQRVKAAGGLRHWFECSDGLLHHRFVALMALEAWIEKLLARKSSSAGNAKRWGVSLDDTAIDALLTAAVEHLWNLDPQSKTLRKKALAPFVSAIPVGTKDNPTGSAKASRRDTKTIPVGSQETGTYKRPDIDSSNELSPPNPPDEIQQAFDAYNDMAARTGLPRAAVLNDQRRGALRNRLKEAGGLDGWRHAVGKVETTAWMHGHNDRGWVADLDFMLQRKSFTRLMEGGYDRKPGRSTQSDPVSEHLERERQRLAAREPA